MEVKSKAGDKDRGGWRGGLLPFGKNITPRVVNP